MQQAHGLARLAVRLAPGARARQRSVIGQQALQAGQALADQGQEVARPTDILDHRLQIVALHRLGVALAEDHPRDGVQLQPLDLQGVGVAVDDGLDQPHHDGLAAGQLLARLVGGASDEDLEGARLAVAHRHQPPALEDEGHGRLDRVVGLQLRGHGGDHKDAAVFGVEAGRRLDIVHLVPAGDVDAGQGLQRRHLIGGRGDEVDPAGGAVIHGRVQAHEPIGAPVIGVQHKSLPFARTPSRGSGASSERRRS